MKSNRKIKESIPDMDKKSIVKQVVFDQGEWDIVQNAMNNEKINIASVFLRRAVLLYIGKNIQLKIPL
jgi:phage terminase large subunit-like protein